MKILRLAWSSYQNEQSLHNEKQALEKAGFKYARVGESGDTPKNINEYNAIIINSQFPIDKPFIEKWTQGRLLITASSGYDRIDHVACREAGITVARTPESRAKRVTDHTMAMMDALLSDLPRSNEQLRQGQWDRRGAFHRINRIESLTVGILGYGVIGKKIAKRIASKNPYELLIADPNQEGDIENNPEADLCTCAQLCTRARVLTLHTDLNDSTRKLIDRNVFEQMPDQSYLINTARGEIVVWEDLIEALESGSLSGAAIDVFPEEPYVNGDQTLPNNLLLTPHSAGFGPGLLDNLRAEILDTLRQFRDRGTVPHPVN